MFDFEKFPVYIKAEAFYEKVLRFLVTSKTDPNLKDQLKRAASSIVLNIAEGAGKYSKNDKKNFYITSRASVHECVAIIRILRLEQKMTEETFTDLYRDLNDISRMLSGMIKSMIIAKSS